VAAATSLTKLQLHHHHHVTQSSCSLRQSLQRRYQAGKRMAMRMAGFTNNYSSVMLLHALA
jgi:hypothetical protein